MQIAWEYHMDTHTHVSRQRHDHTDWAKTQIRIPQTTLQLWQVAHVLMHTQTQNMKLTLLVRRICLRLWQQPRLQTFKLSPWGMPIVSTTPLYIYIYVCIYIYMYIYIHTHTLGTARSSTPAHNQEKFQYCQCDTISTSSSTCRLSSIRKTRHRQSDCSADDVKQLLTQDMNTSLCLCACM